MIQCDQCGVMISGHDQPDDEALSLHMLTQHTEAVVDHLTSKALKEAYEIYELNRLFKLRVH